MIGTILQISIWIISYFAIGENGYAKEQKSLMRIAFFRSGLFLILSILINGFTNVLALSVFPALVIFVVNYCFEDKVKGKHWPYILSLFLQLLSVVTIFIYKEFFELNYFDLIKSLKHDREVVLKAFSILICLSPANLFIRIVLDNCLTDIQKSKSDSLEKAGRLIGNVERTLTLGLLYANQFEAIGFLIAAKSIIRTKEIQSDSEYILIGTLLSFGFSILIGLIVKSLLNP